MYNSKNYTEQGGERTVIGGALVFEEGATIEGFPGAANQADSTATTVATLKDDFNALLYHMGIKDQRVIMMIKSMLKAGIMDECDVNEDGTPQGGILSPLLANVYLDILDEYVAKQWINKKTVHQYTRQESKTHALKARSNLIPGVLVRYADDFVIITDSREHAHFWKERIGHFLEKKMKLTLSPEKTLITDVRKRYIQFLGYEYKVVRGKSRKGYIPRTIPNRKRLKSKVEEIHANILAIPKNVSRDVVIRQAGVEVTGSALTALGTIKWYKDGSTTALSTTGPTLNISAGDVTNRATYIAQLEA